jgi:hypothetical protein
MKNIRTGLQVLGIGLIGGCMASFLSGCLSQNPYPETGKITADPPQVKEVQKIFFIDAPDSFIFKEQQNEAVSFRVLSRVPDGETPVLSASGLPGGATFDPDTGTFSWKPGANTGHDPQHPEVFEKHYPVHFELRSREEPLQLGYQRDVDIVVQGVSMPLDIEVSAKKMEANEGDSFSVSFKVKSEDFPQGPFNLQMEQLPDGATLTPSDKDPTAFTFTFNPAFNFVTSYDSQDASGYIKTVHLKATAIGPRAQKVQKTFDLVVHDVRQQPTLSLPESLVFSYEAEFSVRSEDLNGESTPDVTVIDPAFGTVTVETERANQGQSVLSRGPRRNPVAERIVRWTGIPAAQMHKEQKLTVRACVHVSFEQPDECVEKTVLMSFEGQLHNVPVFDLRQWGQGEVKYLRKGSSLQVFVEATDPDSHRGLDAEVQPKSMRSEVQYSDGMITIKPTSVGTKVFELVARSSFGVEAHQSFTFRALPKSWGSTILLGQSQRDTEVEATLSMMNDAQVLNPAMTSIDDDALMLRKSAFITTSAINSGISSSELGSLLSKTTSALERVIVSSPLVGKFPRLVIPDDLTLAGRFNDLTLPNKPTLNAMSIVPTASSGFVNSQKAVKLNQSLTSESANPMTFTVKEGGSCETLLVLKKDDVELPVAVSCALEGGNKVLFAGFEFGDLAFDPADSALGQIWLQSWQKTDSQNVRKKGGRR